MLELKGAISVTVLCRKAGFLFFLCLQRLSCKRKGPAFSMSCRSGNNLSRAFFQFVTTNNKLLLGFFLEVYFEEHQRTFLKWRERSLSHTCWFLLSHVSLSKRLNLVDLGYHGCAQVLITKLVQPSTQCCNSNSIGTRGGAFWLKTNI